MKAVTYIVVVRVVHYRYKYIRMKIIMQKMYTLKSLLFLICAVTYVFAAARVYPYEPKPAKYACKEGCYLSELDRVLLYNKPYYPKGKCEVYTCQTTNQTYWYSCGVIAVQPGYRLVQDLSQHYPDCCSKVVCDTTTSSPTCDDPSNTEPPSTIDA